MDNIWTAGGQYLADGKALISISETVMITFLKNCVMKHFPSLPSKSQSFYLPEICITSKKLTNSSGYVVLIIYWRQQILSARNRFAASFERDKCPFITSVSYPCQWTRDMRIQDFLIITMKPNKGVYKMEVGARQGGAFSGPHFAPRVWAKPTEGIFQLTGIPGPLLMDFNGLQTVTSKQW